MFVISQHMRDEGYFPEHCLDHDGNHRLGSNHTITNYNMLFNSTFTSDYYTFLELYILLA